MSSSVRVLENGRVLKRIETSKPDRAEVESAFRTIIRWTGDDPERDGLIDTPARVARAFEEYFAGYGQDPALILQKTFEVIEGYDEMIVLRGIRFESHCEHHLAPIIGRVWVAYIPSSRSRHQQARPGRRGLCQTTADSGEDDRTDCQHDRR